MRFCLAVLLVLLSGPSWAQNAVQGDNDPQVWLLTYGPGEIYWQRFGHNALWIRDPATGIDHTFNYGFFDFTQENFLKNFVQGRLNYFAAARPAEIELAEYIDQDRSIRAQRLHLNPEQAVRLRDYLVDQVSPEHREYLYDYYLNNCSTRIRDALDLVLDGALRDELENSPARQDFRQHTRRLTEMDWPYYLGLQAGLASPIDASISRWDETFIPGILADAVAEMAHPETGESLVMEDSLLHESSLAEPGEQAQSVWHRYFLMAGVLLVVAWALCFVPGINARRLALSWWVIAGLLGGVLFFLWFFTDHWVSRSNLNLLLLNPLWLIFAIVPALRKPGAWLVVVSGLLAVFMQWLPPDQYTADIVALVLPLNLAAAIILGSRPQDRSYNPGSS